MKIAVVIPCYRVRDHILKVLSGIGSEVSAIYVVDDCCPEQTGEFVRENVRDARVVILKNPVNLGVGGAVTAGYRRAIQDHADVIVKIDGDGQMDPTLIPAFVAPIATGEADYVKGNRFFDPEGLASMPFVRLLGNSILSFLTKISTGYWTIFDPTNGFTVIHARVAEQLPFDKISNRYFFETDMLFRLGSIGAAVVDMPMAAVYGEEKSNLRIRKAAPEFLFRHFKNTVKRIFYRYAIRDFSIASLELLAGSALVLFGLVFGGVKWYQSYETAVPATAGTVMIAALPLLVGIQMLIAFFNYDVISAPKRALHPALSARSQASGRLLSVRAKNREARAVAKKS